MRVAVKPVAINQARDLVKAIGLTEANETTMASCLKLSSDVWVGLVDDILACIWGVIPPTLMSNQAYLWLYSTELIAEHQFTFVRHSQLVVEELLKHYELITGVTDPTADRSKRWLKWLGAKFGEPSDGQLPFIIRRK